MQERILALALAGCAIAVSPAAAATPAFRTPDRGALRALGVDVAWPAAQSLTNVASGSLVAVDVRRVRHGRSGRLALIAVSATGRPIRLVAHRGLRPGRFAVQLPARPGARYLLALDLDGRRFASPVTTTRPPPPPPPPPAPPAGPAPCNGPAEAATLAFPGPSAHAGDQVLATLVNTGKSCFSYHALVNDWQREQWDGTWVDVAAPYSGYPLPPNVAYSLAFWRAEPGVPGPFPVTVWPIFTPGHYRVLKTLDPGGVTVSAEIDVVP